MHHTSLFQTIPWVSTHHLSQLLSFYNYHKIALTILHQPSFMPMSTVRGFLLPLELDRYLSIITGYNLISTTVLLLWDILLTLPKEIIYIWSYDYRKANWTTLFYIITRYVPFAVSAIFLCLRLIKEYTPNGDTTFPQDLNIFNDLQKFLWFVVLACTEILFIKRTVALYNGSKVLFRILIGLFICELIAGIISFILLDFRAVNMYSTIVKVQTDSSIEAKVRVPFPVIAFTLPELAFQALLVLLIIKKIHSNFMLQSDDLVSIVIRDGLWSYLCNLCGLLILIIHPTWLSLTMGQPNLLWSYATFSVTSSRLILNIRAATARRTEVPSTPSVARSRLTMIFQEVHAFLTSGLEELAGPTRMHMHRFDIDSGVEHDMHDNRRHHPSNDRALV